MDKDVDFLLEDVDYLFHFFCDGIKMKDLGKKDKYSNYSIDEVISLARIKSLYDDGLIDSSTRDDLVAWLDKYVKLHRKLLNVELYKWFDKSYDVDEEELNREYSLVEGMLSKYGLLDNIRYNDIISNYSSNGSLLKIDSNDLSLVNGNFVLFSYSSFFDVYLLLRDYMNYEILYILDNCLEYRDRYKSVKGKDLKYFPIPLEGAKRIIKFVDNKLNLEMYAANFDISKSIIEVNQEYKKNNSKKLGKVIKFPNK